MISRKINSNIVIKRFTNSFAISMFIIFCFGAITSVSSKPLPPNGLFSSDGARSTSSRPPLYPTSRNPQQSFSLSSDSFSGDEEVNSSDAFAEQKKTLDNSGVIFSIDGAQATVSKPPLYPASNMHHEIPGIVGDSASGSEIFKDRSPTVGSNDALKHGGHDEIFKDIERGGIGSEAAISGNNNFGLNSPVPATTSQIGIRKGSQSDEDYLRRFGLKLDKYFAVKKSRRFKPRRYGDSHGVVEGPDSTASNPKKTSSINPHKKQAAWNQELYKQPMDTSMIVTDLE